MRGYYNIYLPINVTALNIELDISYEKSKSDLFSISIRDGFNSYTLEEEKRFLLQRRNALFGDQSVY